MGSPDPVLMVLMCLGVSFVTTTLMHQYAATHDTPPWMMLAPGAVVLPLVLLYRRHQSRKNAEGAWDDAVSAMQNAPTLDKLRAAGSLSSLRESSAMRRRLVS
jgi:protein-S-isoprenylcysteine O-methyltransferase Ste14